MRRHLARRHVACSCPRGSRLFRCRCVLARLVVIAFIGAIASTAFVSTGAGVARHVVIVLPPSDPATWLVAAGRPPTPAYLNFLATYWNAATATFYARSDHAGRAGGGRYADFWWTAELWETVMDAYERNGRAADRGLIGAVYEGFLKRFPTFASDFNDDRGWWALASARAYRLTGERRFLDRSVALFEGIWRSWDGIYGGGLWWRRSIHDQKNVATNGVAAMTAATLYELTHKPIYRTRAVSLFRWIDRKLRVGTRINDHLGGAGRTLTSQFTYNYGVYLGAAARLFAITGTNSYLTSALSVADRAVDTLAPGAVLQDEGTGDGGGFKGILVRNLRALIRISPNPHYSAFLEGNATAAAASQRSDGLNGPSWTHVPGAGPIDSLTEASAVVLFELTGGR